MDNVIDEFTKRKVQPFITLCSHSDAHFDYPPTYSEDKMNFWLNFVKALVERYCDRVHHWELWNEPNIAYFWKPKPNPGDYARLVKESSKIIKQVDPKAVILAGVIAGIDITYAKDIFAQGIAPYIDKFVFHPYGEIPEADVHLIEQLKALIKRHGREIGLWQGECGYPSTENTAGWYGSGPWGEKIQAKWILRRLLTDISIGAEVSCIYTLTEQVAEIEDPVASDYGQGGINTKGLLRFGSWQPKPAYFAYQNLTGIIDSSFIPTTQSAMFKIVKIVDYGIFYGLRVEKVKVVEFSKLGDVLLAYWLTWRPQEIINPAKVNISLEGSIRIEEPVLIDLLNGAVYDVNYTTKNNKQEFQNIPLTDYPMILTSRKLVYIVKSPPHV